MRSVTLECPLLFFFYPYLSLRAPLFPLWHGEVSQDDGVYFSSRIWSRRGHDLACVPLHMYLTGVRMDIRPCVRVCVCMHLICVSIT